MFNDETLLERYRKSIILEKLPPPEGYVIEFREKPEEGLGQYWLLIPDDHMSDFDIEYGCPTFETRVEALEEAYLYVGIELDDLLEELLCASVSDDNTD